MIRFGARKFNRLALFAGDLAWRAIAVVARRRGEGRAAMLEPPFVGRDEELRALKDQLHATAREGKPRLVTL